MSSFHGTGSERRDIKVIECFKGSTSTSFSVSRGNTGVSGNGQERNNSNGDDARRELHCEVDTQATMQNNQQGLHRVPDSDSPTCGFPQKSSGTFFCERRILAISVCSPSKGSQKFKFSTFLGGSR